MNNIHLVSKRVQYFNPTTFVSSKAYKQKRKLEVIRFYTTVTYAVTVVNLSTMFHLNLLYKVVQI